MEAICPIPATFRSNPHPPDQVKDGIDHALDAQGELDDAPRQQVFSDFASG